MFKRLFRGARRRPESSSPRPTVAGNERIYAIGDIHGRHDLAERLVEQIFSDASRFDDGRRIRLIFLGDYIDRGDHSREVLECLVHLAQEIPDDRIAFLRGNHEAALLGFLADPALNRDWLGFGGYQTCASYLKRVPDQRATEAELIDFARDLEMAMEPHLGFLRRTGIALASGDTVFAHAGFDASKPVDEQPGNIALWGGTPDKALPDNRLLVHGHFDAEKPVDMPNRICVDTGAYYSGRLTAVRLDEDRFFLSTV